jgi:hypothetical protein
MAAKGIPPWFILGITSNLAKFYYLFYTKHLIIIIHQYVERECLQRRFALATDHGKVGSTSRPLGACRWLFCLAMAPNEGA